MSWNSLFTKLNPFKKKEEVATPTPEVLEETLPEPVEEIEKPLSNKKKAWGNQGKEGTWKIQEGDKQMIVSLWASGLTPTEVVDRAKEEFNIEISKHQVLNYSKAEKWQPLIKKIRQETFSDLAAVAGSHKRVRLERSEKVFEKALKKGDLKHSLAATEAQRKEMEGGGDFNVTLNQYNVLSDEELEFKKEEVLKRIALKSKGVIDVKPTNKADSAGS